MKRRDVVAYEETGRPLGKQDRDEQAADVQEKDSRAGDR